MCGIVACRTSRPALDFILPGLRTLEYRGYDSAGCAVQTTAGDVVRLRSVGRLDALGALVESSTLLSDVTGLGVGHTRWATHGAVTLENSHPHVDCESDVHVVHNGVIENAAQLRAELSLRGHRFATGVDSEVVAHLVEEDLDEGAELVDAVDKATSELVGSWALAVVRAGDESVVLAAHRSPLVVAHGPDGCYAASDLTALTGWVQEFHVVGDGDIVELTAQGLRWRRADGSGSVPQSRRLSISAAAVELGEAPDFMSKEIAEQAATTQDIVDRLGDRIADGSLWRDLGLPALDRVRFTACGTSLNAADILGRVLAAYQVPSCLGPASEQVGTFTESGTVVIALSQSGETADVLRSLDELHGTFPVLALTNVETSSLGRAAQAVVELGAGPEMGVAATKTFSAQVITGVAVLVSGLAAAGRITIAQADELVIRLRAVPAEISHAHDLAAAHCADVAPSLAGATGFLFVARGAAVPYAAEGALKLKELTYRWTECQPAGELKHGPIALVESGTPVVVIDDGHAKLPTNVAEVRARHGRVLDVGGPGSALPYRSCPPSRVPWGPVASVVVVQHLAREVALVLGRDVDKPRNLAKSVTVE